MNGSNCVEESGNERKRGTRAYSKSTAKSSRKGDISNPQPATPRGASWGLGSLGNRKDLAPDLSGRQIFEDFWHFHGQANFESDFRKSCPGPSGALVRALRCRPKLILDRLPAEGLRAVVFGVKSAFTAALDLHNSQISLAETRA